MSRVKPGKAALKQRRTDALERLKAHAKQPHTDDPAQLDRHKEEIKKLEDLTK